MGRADRRKVARRAARRRRRSLLRELPVIGLVALVIALGLKTFLVQVFVIPSGSMENTIRIGDRVLVDKLTPWFGSTPHRGDVVVFRDPGGWLDQDRIPSTDGPVTHEVKKAFVFVGLLPSDDEQDLIKRVIGVGGDTVACCDSHGRVTVNGTPIEEPYLHPGNSPSRIRFTVVVPPGRLWVMGDHRNLSADSRFHRNEAGGGTVPVANVVGRAFLIGWPVDRIRRLPEPASLASLPPPRAPAAAASAAGKNLPQHPAPGHREPDPGELPLVMGVVAALPHVRRKQRTGGRSRR